MELETPDQAELTRLLNGWLEGLEGSPDGEPAEALMQHVQRELHAIARHQLVGQEARHTLQPTALVHEAYLRLFSPGQAGWNDRKHFYALAARVMRQILVDHARTVGRQKRGGDLRRVNLDSRIEGVREPQVDLLDLDETLTELHGKDSRQGRIVELRFFAGLEVQETADVMGLSRSTVEREWRAARAWLGLRLEGWGG